MGCFVVELLETGVEATGGHDLMGAFVRLQDLVYCPQWHGFDMHIVAVEVVQHKHVVVECSGGVREPAGLICEDLVGHEETLRKHRVGAPAARK